MSVNPREGWRSDLKGGVDERVVHELTTIPNMEKTIIRDKESGLFLPELGLGDSPRGKRAMITGEENRRMVDPLTYTKGTEAEQEKLLQTLRVQHLIGLEEKSSEVAEEEEGELGGGLSESRALLRGTITNDKSSLVDGGSRTHSVVQIPGGSTLSLCCDLPHAGLTKSQSITALKEKMHNHSVDFMGNFKQSTFNRTLKKRIADRAMLECDSIFYDKSTLEEQVGPGGIAWDDDSVAEGDLPVIENAESNPNTPGKGLIERGRSGLPSLGFGFGPGDTASFEETRLTHATLTTPASQSHENGNDDDKGMAHTQSASNMLRDRDRKEVGDDALRLSFTVKTEMARRTREAVYAAEEEELGGDGKYDGPPMGGAAHEEKLCPDGEIGPGGPTRTRRTDVLRSTMKLGHGAADVFANVNIIMDKMAEEGDGNSFCTSEEGSHYTRTDTLGTPSTVKKERRQAEYDSWERDVEDEERAKLLDVEKANLAQLRDRSRVAARLNDDTLLDGTDLFPPLREATPPHTP